MEYEKELKKGTTTVGLLCTDGVIIASERKATMGNLVANAETQKVFEIAPHLGMTVAGMVGDAQRLVKIMQAETALFEIQRRKIISVESAATLLANILQNNKYFPYWVQLLLGGYDTKPALYSLDAAGGMSPEKVVSTGSGSPMAFGVLEDHYQEGKTIKENLPIAIRALKSAVKRDVYSGGKGFNVAIITKKGIEFLTDDKIKKIE